MGIFDKAKDLIEQHDEKIDATVQKVGDFLDEKTGGKHADKIDNVVNKIQEGTGSGDTAP